MKHRLQILAILSLSALVSSCGPKWLKPDATEVTYAQGSVVLFEPGRSHQVGEVSALFWKVPLELQPVRRVSDGHTRYTVRFTIGDKSWEEEEATIRNLTTAYEAYKDAKVSNTEVLLNSWISVQGVSGAFEYSLLDDEMNIDGTNVGKAAAFMKAANLVLEETDKMKSVSPTVSP
ncbi:MAG: hypothetical protein KDK97_16075 [Verrucomicrobiales bacterium]|nr:hypothetical protein [Verrucomicrobiales bacterium]MCP5560320.1 hypothetical protein [Verrucomicrobiaceae bacterium]